MTNRNPIFDIMKGIAIILVILGHEAYISSEVKHYIFAFHMPLFFILSGYFYHRGTVAKDLKRLILPYFFTGLLLLFYNLLSSLPSVDVNLLKRDVLKIIWGSGSFHSAPIAGDKPCIGAIWFLLALFWCKTAFGLIERSVSKIWVLGLICVSVSYVSILLDKYCIYLPWSVFPGLAALVFYFVGYCMKRFKTLPLYIAIVCLIFFVVIAVPVFKYPKLGLVNCNYGIYPLSVCGAFGGTILVYYVSGWLSGFFVGKIFAWIGKLTLPILCFHLFQLNTSCCMLEVNNYVALSCAIAFPLIWSWICTKIGALRSIFGIKPS